MRSRCFSRRLRFEPLETRLLLATFTVTNTLNSGAGSLRQAITDANASADGGDIVFQVPATDPNYVDVDSLLAGGDAGPDVWRIQPLSSLPALSNANGGISIAGSSQTNFLGNQNPFGPEIVLDGNGVANSGLRLTSNDNSISGLNIQRFNSFGISIDGGDRNKIYGNYVGVNATGTAAAGNAFSGVSLSGAAAENLIGTNADGTDDALEGNVLSGNGSSGIAISDLGTDSNIVAGNFIGTDPTGTVDLGNASAGVGFFSGASFNRIGGSVLAARNLISGNGSFGVLISSAPLDISTGNVVIGNYIGTNLAGSVAIANGSAGVAVSSGSTNNRIGTDGDGQNDATEGNLVSGNASSGIAIFSVGTSGNLVAGNRIGTNAAGSAAIPNTGSGLSIFGGATGNRVGTNGDGISDAAERNIISGNQLFGVSISNAGTSGNVVAGNFIGVNAEATSALGNVGSGVSISGADSNRIGTDGNGQGDAAERNIIGGNTGAGVNLTSAGTANNVVAGNSIGTDATGVADLGNGTDGVQFTSSAQNNLLGGAPAVGNTIAFNRQNGVELSSTAGAGNAILGNSIYSNSFFGIDLGADQITPNDDQDADTGPNLLQNTPEISDAILGQSTLRVTYFVPTALANATYPLRVEFFLADADSHEGQTFLGADEFSAADFLAGPKTLILVPAAAVTASDQIVATATDTPATGPGGNTSEFSVDRTVLANPWFNAAKPFNVDGDAGIFAADALDVINYLNAFGSVPVPVNASGPPFYDTNNDFTVSAGDALDIINFLNAGLGGEGEPSSPSPATSAIFADLGSQEPIAAADLAALLSDSLPGTKPRRSRSR